MTAEFTSNLEPTSASPKPGLYVGGLGSAETGITPIGNLPDASSASSRLGLGLLEALRPSTFFALSATFARATFAAADAGAVPAKGQMPTSTARAPTSAGAERRTRRRLSCGSIWNLLAGEWVHPGGVKTDFTTVKSPTEPG